MRLDLLSVVQSYFLKKIPSPPWQTAVGPHMVHGSLAWFCSHTFCVNGGLALCSWAQASHTRGNLCSEHWLVPRIFILHQIPIDYPGNNPGHIENRTTFSNVRLDSLKNEKMAVCWPNLFRPNLRSLGLENMLGNAEMCMDGWPFTCTKMSF